MDEFKVPGEVCNRVGLRRKGVGDMIGWLGSSVVECSRGQRNALGSSPVEPRPFTCNIYLASYINASILNDNGSSQKMPLLPLSVSTAPVNGST